MNHDENLCAEIESTLPLYVGGDLEAKALQEVRLHLGDCPRCAERALAARSARRELVAALRLESRGGPDLWAGVRAALVEENVLAAPKAVPAPIARPTPRISWRWAAAAAAVALGFWVATRTGAPTEPVPVQPQVPMLVHEPHVERRTMEPNVPVVPVYDAGVAPDVAVVPVSAPSGLRRLNPDERQLRDSAPEILGDRAFLYGGVPMQMDGVMQPVGLQRVGPAAHRW